MVARVLVIPRRGAAGFALLLALVCPNVCQDLRAQPVVRTVDARASCQECRIDVRRGPLLGDIDDAELLGDLVSAVVLAEDGRILVAGASGLDAVLVYGADGRFLQRIGRRGQGPGELQHVTGVKSWPGDSILALQIGRATWFDAGGNPARTSPTSNLRANHALSIDAAGRIVYSSIIRTPELAGLQYHLFDGDFEHVRSFGTVPPEIQADCSRCTTHTTFWSAARPGAFWVLPPNRYEIGLWHESGRELERLPVRSSWFEAWHRDPPRSGPVVDGVIRLDAQAARPTTPPDPRLTSIGEDASGLLWVTAFVPSADWTPPPPGPAFVSPQDTAHLRALREHTRRSFDTIIEVIDPAEGRLLASTRLRGTNLTSLGAGRYYQLQNDPRTGLVQLQMWSASLVRGR
jgi:hypothetical protein